MRVNDDKALVVAVENRSVVFQGAVGAFCASIAPAASTGLLRMTHVSRRRAASTPGEFGTAARSANLTATVQDALSTMIAMPADPWCPLGLVARCSCLTLRCG